MESIDKKMIMVIDDDAEFLDETCTMLSLNGYRTTPLQMSRFAVLQACNIRPDLILLDLNMGDFNGFEVATQLQSLSETKDIPLVAVTGFYQDKDDLELMKNCGINNCLFKPVSSSDIISTIEKTFDA